MAALQGAHQRDDRDQERQVGAHQPGVCHALGRAGQPGCKVPYLPTLSPGLFAHFRSDWGTDPCGPYNCPSGTSSRNPHFWARGSPGGLPRAAPRPRLPRGLDPAAATLCQVPSSPASGGRVGGSEEGSCGSRRVLGRGRSGVPFVSSQGGSSLLQMQMPLASSF